MAKHSQRLHVHLGDRRRFKKKKKKDSKIKAHLTSANTGFGLAKLPTINWTHFLWVCASGKTSEVSSFISGRTCLHTLLVTAVIYKSFTAAGYGPVALCCSEMLSLAGV